MEDLTKTIMFTTNSIQNGQPTTIQYQTADGTILKQPKIEGQKNQEYPTFCYTTGNGTTVNLVTTGTGDDNKTCYIAQPLGPYNYALVNQMQLTQNGQVAGIATVDNQGRLQVVNKPITTNTISNISFKCDVCGLMFSHLTLLNHHKRIHNQNGTNDNQDGSITVVTTQSGGQNILQGQTLVSETGQPLGQIQIVATESLEPALTTQIQHQQQHQQQQHSGNGGGGGNTQEITVSSGKTLTLEKGKCSICGTSVLHSGGKRKNTKIRCENCINNDNNGTNINNNQNQLNVTRSTQIFVAPDGDVKFEMSELPESDTSLDSLTQQQIIQVQGGQQIVHIQQQQQHMEQDEQQQQQNQQQQQQQHLNKNQIAQSNIGGVHHPVKKRNLASVTKCQKCNGSGVIFIGGNTKQVIKTEQPKPFVCNICGGTFSRYSSLWSHKKLHSGEKNYKCEICGLAFAKAVYLKNHRRIHTGEKPYKCLTCGMQFSQSPHLKNHERTHSGEKPYVCEVCDKGFARHATLWNHRRIHTGEKPYKCETCGSAFSQAAHLKNHAKVHSGEKPFKCDICSAAFADRFALKRHRGIHEKYGQTAPRQPQIKTDIESDPLLIHKEEMPDMDDEPQTTEVII